MAFVGRSWDNQRKYKGIEGTMSNYLDIEKLIGRDNFIDALWDDKEKLQHIDCFHPAFPLRITLKEWESSFAPYDVNWSIYACGRFTLVSSLYWTGNVEAGGWDYCDVYEVICPSARPQRGIFGPHKTLGLAKKKALDYLVNNGAIEIIGE